MRTLAEVYQDCHSAVFSEMYKLLADNLGINVNAVEHLGLGFDYAYQAWVIPERDAAGNIIGLSYRYSNNKKTMAPGLKHKRGLIYPINQNFEQGLKRYIPGMHNWVRIADVGVECPICKKKDGCLVSAEDPIDPTAAICIRPEGKKKCDKDLGQSGYLHIIRHNKSSKNLQTILPTTDLPILIVEGASDVMAAMSLGFIAIGRPNNLPCELLLGQMPIAGKTLWIIGENDAGAGKQGMEDTYTFLRTVTPDVVKVLPPDSIKDLRAWYQIGLTQQTLIDYVNINGIKSLNEASPDIFESDSILLFAEAFLKANYIKDGIITLRKHFGSWLIWTDGCYKQLSIHELKGQIYNFLDRKRYFKETPSGKMTARIKPDKRLISDLLDALNKWCPIKDDPPVWLTKTDKPKPSDLIVFPNGLLDVNRFINGEIKLYDPDPNLFTMSVLPYNFDDSLLPKLSVDYFKQIFNEDKEVIRLIQQWFGYNLVPDTSQEKMMLFTGRPRSGKSTTLDMMRALLGYEQCCALQMSHLCSRFGRQPMLGKLAAIFGDVKTPRSSEAGMALETLLTIVGQDAVSIDRKGVEEIPNVKLHCRITLVMNDIPTFSDHARALAPRMLITYFPNSYVGREDRGLKGQLEEEVSSGKLIMWALNGLKDLRVNKHFVDPVSSMGLLTQLELANSPVLAFINECCIVKTGETSSKNDLFAVWTGWCHSNGKQSGSKDQFGRWVLNACPGLQTARRRLLEKAAGNFCEREYCFDGIVIKPGARQAYLFDRIR